MNMNTDHLDPAPEMPKKYHSDSQNKMCPHEEITKFYLEQINNTTENFSVKLQEIQDSMKTQVEESSQQKLETMKQQLEQYI